MARELSANVEISRDGRPKTLGHPDICIAVIDSRADLAHPCFAGAQLQEVMPVWLRSVMGPSGASHGTHVTSVIFGQPGGPVEGIAPLCRGIVIPVYGETEGGDLRPCSQEDLARAISLALQAGAHLINISGGELIEPGDVDPFLAQVVRSCEQQDVMVIAAAGNDGCECLHAPASLPTVLAVGAADARGQPMPFSNWDESLASHGVLAPGESVQGAVPGNGVALKNGTSFACPIVTGMAALLFSEQKLRGVKPSARAVRDAIVSSAIPCMPEEQSQCERMLGGRINLTRARDLLFKSDAVTPSAHACAGADVIRSPPGEFTLAARRRPDAGGIRSFVNSRSEGTFMANEQVQVHPQGATQADRALSHAGGVAAASSMTSPAVEMSPANAVEQSVGVSPQEASCGCGAKPQHTMNPPPQMVAPAQQEIVQALQPNGPLYHGGAPVQSPYGTQPATTPAQRTAMIAGFPGSAGGQIAAVQAGRGVAPSQSPNTIPMPTDFINSANSQLVYVTGELGYDFITDARRDYFVQRFREMSDDHDYIKAFSTDLGLEPGPLYLPEDNRAMAAYLYQSQLFTENHPAPQGRFGEGPTDIGSVVWILIQEGQPLYALRPLHTFAVPVLQEFANFLYDQSRPEFLDEENKTPNPNRSERVSIAARILGDITLYNGQQVPVLDASLRALFNWNLKFLIEGVLGARDQASDPVAYDADYERLTNFLERIYYESRNLGQAPSDRATNYLTTNLFQANQAFQDALKDKLELDSIFAEKSPLCRPKSDCWDVVMRFFDPNNRLGKALTEYRLTVDVSDISPVGIGKVRKWARFA